MPRVKGCDGSPYNRSATPSRTSTIQWQVSGQSCPQAPRVVCGLAGLVMVRFSPIGQSQSRLGRTERGRQPKSATAFDSSASCDRNRPERNGSPHGSLSDTIACRFAQTSGLAMAEVFRPATLNRSTCSRMGAPKRVASSGWIRTIFYEGWAKLGTTCGPFDCAQFSESDFLPMTSAQQSVSQPTSLPQLDNARADHLRPRRSRPHMSTTRPRLVVAVGRVTARGRTARTATGSATGRSRRHFWRDSGTMAHRLAYSRGYSRCERSRLREATTAGGRYGTAKCHVP